MCVCVCVCVCVRERERERESVCVCEAFVVYMGGVRGLMAFIVENRHGNSS